MFEYVKRIIKKILSCVIQQTTSNTEDRNITHNKQFIIGTNINAVQNNYNGLQKEDVRDISEKVLHEHTATNEEVNEMLKDVFDTNSGR